MTEDTPYEKYEKLIIKQSDNFLVDEILPNPLVHENLRFFLG